jgi:hypothetical protein
MEDIPQEERAQRHVNPIMSTLNSLKEKVMKAILLTILMVLSFTAHADYIDLTGADVLQQAVCYEKGNKFLCAALQFNGKVYFAMVDRKGEYKIFLIENNELNLIWARDAV